MTTTVSAVNVAVATMSGDLVVNGADGTTAVLKQVEGQHLTA